MSPSSTVHGGQHGTKYVIFELLMHAAIFEHQLVCMSRGKSIFIVSGTYLTHTTLSRNIGIVFTLVYHTDILYNEAQSGYVQMWTAQKIYTASASLAWLGRSTSSETNTARCMRCPPPPNQHADARRMEPGRRRVIHNVRLLRGHSEGLQVYGGHEYKQPLLAFKLGFSYPRSPQYGLWSPDTFGPSFFFEDPRRQAIFFVFSKMALHSNAKAMRLTCEHYWSALELWLTYYDTRIPRH